MTKSLGVELRGRVLHLTIDRPAAKNAIDEKLGKALEEACARAGKDEAVHAVLLGSTGDVFLSGGDLNALGELPYEAQGAQVVIGLGLRLAAIEACPVPVIAAVHGNVYGGGCELLVMTDVAVMDADATIHFVHRKMGLVPAWGGCTRLTERVGTARAADILLSARPVNAEEALQIGLVSRVSAGTAREDAEEVANQIARAPREALMRIKRSLRATRQARRGDAMDQEQKIFRDAWGSADHRAAMARFRDR